MCVRELAKCIDSSLSPARAGQGLYCQMSMLVRWLCVFIVRATSGSTVVRLKESAAALGQNLKIGQSSEAVPQAGRKRFDFSSPFFDFIRIFNKATGSGEQVAELRFPHSAKANFPYIFYHHKAL